MQITETYRVCLRINDYEINRKKLTLLVGGMGWLFCFFGWLVVWMSSQLVGQLVGRFGWLINCLLFVVCSSV